MPVVGIRHMRVAMPLRLVPVCVAVCPLGHEVVVMLVMPVVMPVGMLVL
jgi:hypothetical protein